VADARIKVVADASQAIRELNGLDKALGNLDRSAAMAGKALAVITAAAAAVGFAVKKSLDSVDELAKSSRQLGMTAADLQAFRNSASLAGVSSDELTNAFRRLQVNIGQVTSKGTGPAKDALDRLGISLDQLRGLDAGQQFKVIAEEISKIPDPAVRAATATELLGRQGPRLLEAANEFERIRKESEQLGLALTAVDTAAIERAGDAMSEISMIATGFIQKLTAELAPILEVIATRIKNAIMEMGGLDVVIRERVIPAFKLAAQVAAALIAYIAAAKIVAIAAGFAKLATSIIAVARAFRTMGVAAAAAKAIATGGLSAIVTLTAGVAGAIAAATAAGKVMDDLFEDAAEITAEIAANIDDVKENIEDASDAQTQLNDQARKAMEAYERTLTTLRQNVQFQQDSVRYGEEEARILQTIAQERQKLVEAGAELSQQQEQDLRNLLEQENAIKRQNTLYNQRADAVRSMFDNSNIERAIQKRLDLELAIEGKTNEQIMEIRRQRYNDPLFVEAARQNADNAVKIAVDAEIGKYNELVRLEQQYNSKSAELGDILTRYRLNLSGVTTKQYEQALKAKAQLDREYEVQKLEATKVMQDKMLDLERRRIEAELSLNKNAVAQKLSMQDRQILQRIGQEERQASIVRERIEFEKKSEAEKAQWAIQQGASVFNELGRFNKQAFEAAKAFNIANAVMNTYMGATKALATYPPPFNFIAAAAVVASGLAQVAAIRSQSYSGRQLGGPVMNNGSYIVGENGPELFTPTTNGRITRNGDLNNSGPVTVNFNISANDASGFDDLLLQRKGMITQMISDAITERGQRSML